MLQHPRRPFCLCFLTRFFWGSMTVCRWIKSLLMCAAPLAKWLDSELTSHCRFLSILIMSAIQISNKYLSIWVYQVNCQTLHKDVKCVIVNFLSLPAPYFLRVLQVSTQYAIWRRRWTEVQFAGHLSGASAKCLSKQLKSCGRQDWWIDQVFFFFVFFNSLLSKTCQDLFFDQSLLIRRWLQCHL